MILQGGRQDDHGWPGTTARGCRVHAQCAVRGNVTTSLARRSGASTRPWCSSQESVTLVRIVSIGIELSGSAHSRNFSTIHAAGRRANRVANCTGQSRDAFACRQRRRPALLLVPASACSGSLCRSIAFIPRHSCRVGHATRDARGARYVPCSSPTSWAGHDPPARAGNASRPIASRSIVPTRRYRRAPLGPPVAAAVSARSGSPVSVIGANSNLSV